MSIKSTLNMIVVLSAMTILGVALTMVYGDPDTLRSIFVDGFYPRNNTSRWCDFGLCLLIIEGTIVFPFLACVLFLKCLYESWFFRTLVISVGAYVYLS